MFLSIESGKFKGPPPTLPEFLQIKFWEFPARERSGLPGCSIISGKLSDFFSVDLHGTCCHRSKSKSFLSLVKG